MSTRENIRLIARAPSNILASLLKHVKSHFFVNLKDRFSRDGHSLHQLPSNKLINNKNEIFNRQFLNKCNTV